jgi:nucleoid DNA-binding protein/ribosomal protein S15P/S13E
MFANIMTILKPFGLDVGLAQITPTQAYLTPEETVLVFSGPKFLVALLAGVVMAFAFQLLLTNLTVVLASGTDIDPADDEEETIGAQIRKTEAKVGLWAAITAAIALFSASFLAVKLSAIQSATIGAIIGVVIWSTYFTIVMWLGSSAVGSLLGSLVSSVASGLQGLMGTAGAAIGANTAKSQMVSTAEEITAAVRRELTSGLDSNSIQKTLQSSLSSLQLPTLDVEEIRQQFDRFLKDSDLKDLADSDLLKNINRQTFVDLISSRSDLSKKDIDRIADELEGAWKQVIASPQDSTAKVINLIKQASPDDLNSEKLGERIQELVATGGGNGKQSNGVVKQVVRSGVGAATGAVIERLDLSDVDVDKITHQLQNLKGKVRGIDLDTIVQQLEKLKDKTTEQLPNFPKNTVKADVEDYILNSFPWHLNPITLQNEFQEVIYDTSAEPGSVRKQLEEINQEYFSNLLGRRDDIDRNAIASMASQMESIRQDVLQIVREDEKKEESESLRSKIENYLRSTGKEELNPEQIEREFSTVLEDPEAGLEELQNRFSQFDRDTLVQLLAQREDINQEEANNIVGQLESTRDNVLNRVKQVQEQAQAKAQELRQNVENYLRNTNKEELNPDAIERELRTLLEDPQAGFNALKNRISQFDRDTLVQLLTQRQDLSEEQVNQLIERAESVRDSILQAPQQVADRAKQQYEQTTSAIAEYLRKTNLEELDPEGIQQDLTTLFESPQEGFSALRDRLSHVDRETIVKLLSQREDLSEEQVNRIVDEIQEAIQNVVKAPRRLVDRATKQALDFESNLENYLRNTNKEELNPDGIKRDLQLLLNDPRLGVGSLGDRLSKFDRATIVSLLSQREDISEEEANRIVDRIFSARDTIAEQFEKIQQRVQSVLDSIFARIRDYLNSLERPELNYEGIQQDFATLFDDPQAGFDALRDRLSQFDRETLVAVLSSRDDISEEQANQIVDRIEESRDSVLKQAERIQQETQKRLSAIKEQTKKQVRDAKKAAVDAAWWLLGASLTSLAASAIAGFIAVSGVPFQFI